MGRRLAGRARRTGHATATCSSACCSTATPTGPTCRRPSTRRSPSQRSGSASATAPAAWSTSSAPKPAHAPRGRQPAHARQPRPQSASNLSHHQPAARPIFTPSRRPEGTSDSWGHHLLLRIAYAVLKSGQPYEETRRGLLRPPQRPLPSAGLAGSPAPEAAPRLRCYRDRHPRSPPSPATTAASALRARRRENRHPRSPEILKTARTTRAPGRPACPSPVFRQPTSRARVAPRVPSRGSECDTPARVGG
jgi:hypothetical protein